MVNAYNEFNKAVKENEKTFDVSLIERAKHIDKDYEKNKDIYEKLMRNLSLVLNKRNHKMNINDYCRFLNQWVYHSKQKNNISEFSLGVFYPVAHENIVKNGGINRCSYFSYDTMFEEPLNIIKLENFQEDIDIIESILKNEKDSFNSCQKYACECFKIYKKFYQQSYCPYDLEADKKRKSTCDKLRAFKTSYTSYLSNREMKDKVPSLDAAGNVSLPLCYESEPDPVRETAQQVGENPELVSQPGPVGAPRESGSSVSTDESENTKPFNTSTIVSTVAGIPPFLALIYKFTPVGTIFRLKNKKSTNIFNNTDEEIENELFYLSHKNAIINPSNASYNVAYGPVRY
ncbi:Plasmodium vivax Vir protein, putative [Plasmodium vivax]|uniref:Vir protein, putative n=1 Tax=Plasmodium vivax TaxID=5855 RepID=A0A1G4E506_PLAVI|nr:Plasmodium vivax Vir protein, putative [Plasmodium vivax]